VRPAVQRVPKRGTALFTRNKVKAGALRRFLEQPRARRRLCVFVLPSSQP
jgi:hypothetical protein